MSIYASTFSTDAEWADDDEPTGVVLIRDGGTNHYPSPDRNRAGSIDGAHIPAWCVNGLRDDLTRWLETPKVHPREDR